MSANFTDSAICAYFAWPGCHDASRPLLRRLRLSGAYFSIRDAMTHLCTAESTVAADGLKAATSAERLMRGSRLIMSQHPPTPTPKGLYASIFDDAQYAPRDFPSSFTAAPPAYRCYRFF